MDSLERCSLASKHIGKQIGPTFLCVIVLAVKMDNHVVSHEIVSRISSLFLEYYIYDDGLMTLG